MSESKPILLDVSDGVATITFNRPQAKNSLNVEALSALFTAFGTCEDRDDVGAVVLTGAGDAFCAGVNLKGYSLDNREELRAGFREVAMWWHQMLHRIVRIPKPVLSAVNGIAVGGGLGIVLASDIAVCNERCELLRLVDGKRRRQRRWLELHADQDRRLPPSDGIDADQPDTDCGGSRRVADLQPDVQE